MGDVLHAAQQLERGTTGQASRSSRRGQPRPKRSSGRELDNHATHHLWTVIRKERTSSEKILDLAEKIRPLKTYNIAPSLPALCTFEHLQGNFILSTNRTLFTPKFYIILGPSHEIQFDPFYVIVQFRTAFNYN